MKISVSENSFFIIDIRLKAEKKINEKNPKDQRKKKPKKTTTNRKKKIKIESYQHKLCDFKSQFQSSFLRYAYLGTLQHILDR